MPDQLMPLATNVARLEERFNSVEREIKELRKDLKESMGAMQCTLKERALFNERLVHNANEHTHIHGRIDEREERLDEIEELVDGLSQRIEGHNHCVGCQNDKRIDHLENRITTMAALGRDMLDVYKFMKSRWGLAIMLVLFVDILVGLWAHHDLLKKLYDTLTLQ